MKYKSGKNERGFDILNFYDDNMECCDIQRSSSAEESKIWLGTHNPDPKILASRIDSNATGWVKYELPEGVLINHRMHLTRKQSIQLAFRLLKFGLFDKL